MIRQLRLSSGVGMLAYVTMHLRNHAVGLISLKAMEDVLWYIFRIWANRPGQVLLYGSFLVHYGLALWALWQRRSLRLRPSELSQIILGFAIPILLARHVVGTRIADNFFHTDTGYYAYLLWLYFVRVPEYGYLQMLVLVVAWAHAMIGLHFWLRVRPWYARLQSAALVVAVLVPVLSLLGVIEAGRQVMALAIDPPSANEMRVLRRIGARPNIRLACMLRPRGEVEVTPLLPPLAIAADGRSRVDFVQGSEREIAILFADIRGFTALAEGRLPYDVVFVLNRYFSAMGRAIESAGGRVDKFIGDGVMALFGIESGARAGCREALAAARLMSERLAELNSSLRAELDRPLRIGIGIHCGPVIVGEMGYGKAAAITAIGDAVNTASRLETLTKDYDCELVVSDETVARAGLDFSEFPRHEIEIRGKREMLAVTTFDRAADLPPPDAAPIRHSEPAVATPTAVPADPR